MESVIHLYATEDVTWVWTASLGFEDFVEGRVIFNTISCLTIIIQIGESLVIILFCASDSSWYKFRRQNKKNIWVSISAVYICQSPRLKLIWTGLLRWFNS